MYDNISLANYAFAEGGQGFAGDAAANDLIKAMQAGQITGRDTNNLSLTQEPLKVESLETALKLLTFRMQDIALWNAIPKMPAYNTVEEFLQLESYGTDRGGFYNEGELSDVEDSTYVRRSELVKYIQVTGEVTYQAQIVKSYVPAMQKEIQNKMMWVLRKANSAMTKADSNIIPQEWNSLYKQHASIGTGEGFSYSNQEDYYSSKVVFDLRGRALLQNDVEDGSIIVDDAYGTATDLWAPPQVLSDLAKDYYEKQRILLGGTGSNFVGGGTPKSISTTIGEIKLSHDKFMKKSPARLLSEGAQSLKAPASPTTVAAALSGADALSKFTTAEGGLGTVYYAVAAVNKNGESALKVNGAPTAVTLTNGQSINLTITGGTGANAATGYVIYRSKVTGSANPLADQIPFYPLFSVSAAELTAGYDGGSAGVVRDRNRHLPDTETAFMTQMDDEVLSFKQLAPLSKLDLAVLSMSRRFITFLFGTPNLYSGKKMVRFVNIGRYVAA